ncbi:hypothetical protein V8D89_000204 [Ganoderma adspersum]
MEPLSRLPSPWGPDSSPLPSPCPPPSPAYWVPYEGTPASRKDVTHARSLPLIPSQERHPQLRTNTTFSPLPEHPDFLRGLQSHPLIIQRADPSWCIPSPTSSMEIVPLQKVDENTTDPVPFPMSSGFTSPVLCSSPRPLPSIGSSRIGVRSLPTTTDSSPARTPDPAPGPVPAFPSFMTPPPPPPLLNSARNSGQIVLKTPSPPTKKALPRPRLPALRRSTENPLAPGNRPQSTDSASSGSSSCPKHPQFYIRASMVVLKVSRSVHIATSRWMEDSLIALLKVEDSLYRVHKYLLEQHSDFFRGVLSDDADAMGHSDDRALPLPENITRQAFDTLLNFMYTGIYDPWTVSLSDWVSLLRISTLLRFARVREYAIRELSARRAALAPVDVILLAREHDIPAWLGPAYAELVRRPAPLDDGEAERLGARVTAQVGRAREVLRAEQYALYEQRKHGSRYTPSERPDEQLVARAVNEVFQLQPAAAQ